MKIIHGIYHIFDVLEDHVRAGLSRHAIIYTFVGGTGIVLFWRGVWHFADFLQSKGGWYGLAFSSLGSIAIGMCILLGTGLFVSMFIGDSIIISGINKEKKKIEKVIEEVQEVEDEMI